jgi:recombination protein RecT
MRALLPLGGADDCPACGAVHGSLDQFWACPTHGHLLQFHSRDGDLETFKCPAHRCAYRRSAPPKPRTPSRGDPMTAVETRPSTAVDAMYARAAHLERLLPAGLDFGSFAGSAQAALYNNATLMAAAEKDPASFMIALTEAAALGHMPGSKEYYLTPRGGKVLGIEGYRGIVARMYRSAQVAKVVVREVCERDYFDFTEGTDDHPLWRPATSGERTGAGFFGATGHADRGDMVGVYACAKLVTGEWARTSLLWREDVYAARASGGWKADDPYSPWNRLDGGPDHPEFTGRSMWWKTALKRSEPWTPVSSEDLRYRAAAIVPAATVAAPEHTWTAEAVPPPPVRPAPVSGRQSAPRKRLPAGEGNGGVTVGEAIDGEFGRIGLEDPEERLVYVHKLAGTEYGTKLTTGQLAGVMKKLRGYADIGALRAVTDPGPQDVTL